MRLPIKWMNLLLSVLILLIINSIGVFAYLLINYLIDHRSRELINSIIKQEISYLLYRFVS